MPTKKPMTTLTLSDEVFQKIEDFRFNNRFANRSQAIQFILEAGMRALADEYPELDLDTKLETGKKAQDDGVNEERIHI